MSQKYSAVTTFNQSGYDTYGHKMIQSFIKNWPVEVQLHVYTEDCVVKESAPNIIVKDLHQSSPALVKFKHTWKDVPKANGDVSKDPVRSKRRDAGKGFKWHAVRFAHKVYSIFHCAAELDSDFLIWMDADIYCHSPISIQNIATMITPNMDLGYLGRKGKYPECGLYAMNLKSDIIKNFLKEFQRVYDEAENGIFLMDEWHDSYVFEQIKNKFPQMQQLDWAAHLYDLRPRVGATLGEGHPLINSAWGAYLDHLKGARKKLGKSSAEDLKIKRTEKYWL